jgi:hypothetical protein
MPEAGTCARPCRQDALREVERRRGPLCLEEDEQSVLRAFCASRAALARPSALSTPTKPPKKRPLPPSLSGAGMECATGEISPVGKVRHTPCHSTHVAWTVFRRDAHIRVHTYVPWLPPLRAAGAGVYVRMWIAGRWQRPRQP